MKPPAIFRIQRVCLDCLEEIARYWGYNQPNWLKRNLPLMGFRVWDHIDCAKAYNRINDRSDLLVALCKSATLACNAAAIDIMFQFVPRGELELCAPETFKHPRWGFWFLKSRNLTAAVLTQFRQKWVALARTEFQLIFGTRALHALATISPAYQTGDVANPPEQTNELLKRWIYKEPQVPLETVQAALAALARKEMDKLIELLPVQHGFLKWEAPIAYLSEELLNYFPTALLGYRLADLPKVHLQPIRKQHKAFLEALHSAKCSSDQTPSPSALSALAKLLYGDPHLGQALKNFCINILEELPSLHKSKSHLREDVANIEVHRSNAYMPLGNDHRMRHLAASALSCAILAHFYQIQLQFGGMLRCKPKVIKRTFKKIKEDLISLGMTPWKLKCNRGRGELFTAFSAQIVESPQSGLRGEIYLLETQVDVDFGELASNEANPTPVDAWWIGYRWGPCPQGLPALQRSDSA